MRSVLLQLRAVAELLLIRLPIARPDRPIEIRTAEGYAHLARALTRNLRNVGDFLEQDRPGAARAALLRARAIEQELDAAHELTDIGPLHLDQLNRKDR